MHRFAFVVGLVVVGALAPVPPVRAAQAADAPAADAALQAAKAEFEEAQTLYLREQYGPAAARFLAAYDKKPFAAFLFNAAVAFEKGQRLEQALQFFERYLEAEPEAKDAAAVKERITSLRTLVAPSPTEPADKPAAPLPTIETKGLVIIDSKPQGANIYLDDKSKGVFAKTPWQGSLPPRPVKLIVEAKGFKPEERSISPRTDKVYEVYVALSEEHFLGWIEVASNVAGAEVFIDRKDIGAIGRTPYTGHVKPGKHTIWVQKDGYKPVEKQIEVQPGTATTHLLQLEKVDNGWISVVGRQSKGGKLKVNDKVVCDTPCRTEVAPGKYEVVVEKPGFEPFESQVTVERSSETQVDVRFSPKPPRGRAWTSAVLSALFLGGGIYVAHQGRSIRDDLRADIRNGALVDTGDPRVQRGKYHYLAADGLFVLSGVTGILAVVNFLSSGPDSTADVETRSIGFAPMGAGAGAGFVATGRF